MIRSEDENRCIAGGPSPNPLRTHNCNLGSTHTTTLQSDSPEKNTRCDGIELGELQVANNDWYEGYQAGVGGELSHPQAETNVPEGSQTNRCAGKSRTGERNKEGLASEPGT